MDSLRRKYLAALDVDVWLRRPASGAGTAQAPPATSAQALAAIEPRDGPPANSLAVHTMDWQLLEQSVKACTLCALHGTRTKAVFGVGNRQAEWMVIGEAPGADEDRQGEPFVGRGGQLLNSMLGAMGLPREQVF